MIVVTGGAGFIGSHVVRRLLADGHKVLVFDSFDDYYDPARKWQNISQLVRDHAIELRVGDVRDPAALGAALGGGRVEGIVHLAARAGVRPSLTAPAEYMDVNVCGTTRVLEAAAASGVKQIVLASSSSVYGDTDRIPFHEEESALRPQSPYGASKRAMEVAAEVLAPLYGLHVSALRFFTAYGPRQRPDMAVASFTQLIEAGDPVSLFGAGNTERDYTYVEDVVDGIVRALGRTGSPFRIFNLGREETVSLGQLVDALERALGKRATRRTLPEQAGDVRFTSADCSRARRELGYAPGVSIDEGLSRYVTWLRAQG